MKALLIIETILLLYIGLAVLYFTGLALAGHFYKSLLPNSNSTLKRFAVFVPGYKEDFVIVNVIKKLTSLSYPKDLFDIVVIADSFKPETIQALSALPVTLLQPAFEKSSKAKSLNYAFNTLTKNYDVVVILDADNVVESDFLNRINQYMQDGIRAVQAQRVAKNTDTSFSVLDSCSEAINNHIFRKEQNAVGLSSSLIGSGMAFDYSLLKETLAGIESVYEDREIQFALAKQDVKIHYLEGIFVYDEKIDNPDSFQNQRRRWLYAQFKSLVDYFIPGHVMLLKGKASYYNFSVLNNLFPPRLLLLGFLIIVPGLATLLKTPLHIYWWVLLGVYIFCLLISIPGKLYNKQLLVAVFSIPLAFVKMIQALFRMKGASKFIHTTHTKVDVDSVFKNEK